MSEIDMKSLFDESRFSDGWKLLPLLLYTPVGLVLLAIRLLLSFKLWLLASFLPDCDALHTFLNYGLSLVFGIIVKVQKSTDESGIPNEDQSQKKEPQIIIANSVSALDHFAFRRVNKSLSPSVWDIPPALRNALGLQLMDTSGRDALISSIRQFLASSDYNIVIQPEFAATNNRIALLKFNSWPFGIESTVQPVAIKAYRPELLDVKITCLASTWWADVFWFMFMPYTVFVLTYLKVRRNIKDDQEVFTREVEKDIADALNIQTCNYTVLDKKEYEKRYFTEKMRQRNVSRQRPTNNSDSSLDIGATVEVHIMARQVSEVLPLVPKNVILKDLLKTRNVDVTIANILDGVVTYTPVSVTPINADVPECSTSKNGCQANSVTKNNSNLDTMSFQKRKAIMIAEAREKYIQKHGLKLSC